jgi:tetratricopeptide (TPR) repeat protein
LICCNEEAIAHFRRSVALDSKLLQAHLYLASSLAQHFIPGVDTPDNTQYAEQAIAEYSTVMHQAAQGSANQLTAIRSIATLYLQMKKYSEAKDYYRKLIDVDSKDVESYYGIAVIDWTESYTARMKAYAKLGIKPEERRWDIGTCQKTADDHLSGVEEARREIYSLRQLILSLVCRVVSQADGGLQEK